ncbi:MAG TPA: hypothetical protein VJK05_00915 [archaeon]|nr:hypothetical protein [archaeon]
MDEKGQVSLEYLLTVLFSVILAMIAAILAGVVTDIGQGAAGQISQIASESIASLLAA